MLAEIELALSLEGTLQTVGDAKRNGDKEPFEYATCELSYAPERRLS
jgi:hypothetical protein